MANVTTSKVVSALPATLTADTIYYVRVGTGFDLYVTNHSGTIVSYKINPTDLTNYAKTTVVNTFIDGQVISGRLKFANPGGTQLSGAGFAGAIQYYSNNLYLDDGTNNLRLSNQVPIGGTTGQMLVKLNNTDLAVGWNTPFDNTIANTFSSGQKFNYNIQITSTGTNLGPGYTGMLQNINNVLYYDNGTITTPLSTMVPSGGTTGQFLTKSTNADYVTTWSTPSYVTGPASATDTGIVTYSGTTGKITTTAMLSVTATGSLQTFGVGTGTIAGNARGAGATDLQVSRTAATMVTSGANSVITGGTNNTNGGNASFIGGGNSNNIPTANSTIVIVGGTNNQATPSYAFIGGGNGNTISGGQQTVIAGGTINTIGTNADSSAIVGGSNNTIAASATFAFIGGGFTNKINNAGSSYGVIGGGNTNTIAGGLYDVIAGGQTNNLSSTGTHNVISGGQSNAISAGNYNTIAGGGSNTVSGVSSSFIAGGNGNIANGNFSFVTGQFGIASAHGQKVFSSAKFAYAGDAQFSIYTMMATTTDGTTTVGMTLDNTAVSATNLIPLSVGQSKYCYINVTAQGTPIGPISVWEIKALFARTGATSTTKIIGTPTVTQLFSSGSITGATVTPVVDTTNGGFRLNVVGAAGFTLKWLADVQSTELTF